MRCVCVVYDLCAVYCMCAVWRLYAACIRRVCGLSVLANAVCIVYAVGMMLVCVCVAIVL